MKEKAKEISCRKHKSLNFRFLLVAVLTVIATGSFFIACNSDDPFSGDEVNDVDTEMRQILGDHLTIENNRYVLNLSEADAMTLGVSQSFYAKFLDEIVKSNAFIELAENNPNMSVIINENSQDINYKPIRLKDGGNESTVECWYSVTSFNLTSKDHPVSIPSNAENVKLVVTTLSSESTYFSFKICFTPDDNHITVSGNSINGGSWANQYSRLLFQTNNTWIISVPSSPDISNCKLSISYN
jgi:hypothetical protein